MKRNLWKVPLFAVLIGMTVLLVPWNLVSEAGVDPPQNAVRGRNDKEWVHGGVTYIHYSNPHSAATHHGDHQPTFKDGVWLKLVDPKHPRRTFRVHVVDVCAGSACRMLDITPQAFNHLGIPTSQGVGNVRAYCGKRGRKPIRKCLAGEDQ